MVEEYIHFSNEESTYMQKNLLSSQLEALNSVKRLHQYKKLREEEFSMKIKLKTILSSLKSSVNELNKLMPEVEMKSHQNKDDLIIDPTNVKEEKPSIEQEIEKIRLKLARLG